MFSIFQHYHLHLLGAFYSENFRSEFLSSILSTAAIMVVTINYNSFQFLRVLKEGVTQVETRIPVPFFFLLHRMPTRDM